MTAVDSPPLPLHGGLSPPARQVPARRSVASDYVELTKPKIAAMALVTVAVGYLLAADGGTARPAALFHTLVGAGLVAAGGSALNHFGERRADGRMWRTRNRPLPAGRVSAAEAMGLGVGLAAVGVGHLAAALPSPAAAVAAAATFVLYVFVYTPLKRVTAWNTVVGAVPGALPPVIGWAAADGRVGAGGWALFAVLFVWQLPHFFSIAWLYREDYARGGMRMLPVTDAADGRRTGRATVLSAAVLVPVTAAPFVVGSAGWAYLLLAVPVGVWFLGRCRRFAADRNAVTARGVLRGSLVYLLAVMALLVLDGVLPRYV